MITNTSSGLSSLGLLGTSSTFTKPVASKLKVRIALKRLYTLHIIYPCMMMVPLVLVYNNRYQDDNDDLPPSQVSLIL